MQTIAIDDPSVCQSVTRAGCVKTAERIAVLFEVQTLVDLKNIVSPWGPDLSQDSMRPSPNHSSVAAYYYFMAHQHKAFGRKY